MMSRKSVEGLKHSWKCDPCWNIEGTEGYEVFRDELRAFQAEKEASWEADRMTELQTLSAKLGCPGNFDLARKIQAMEYQIGRLLDRVIELEDSAP